MGLGELTVSSIAQDALSDFSESSRDEIREMLGPDVYQERFRVDRSKLERMIQDEEGSAEMFFQRIMENTNTYISWPHRLKVGAKSKKDPHVRIAGLPEDVKIARERVLDVLDAKTDRVNMKLDVSYTDHSHIIGKGGHTIKRVMESTGCHIHFPDSNRSSSTEKSNQVSIAGTLEGVEKARCNIRRLMPLIFSFELPVTGSLQPMPDSNSPDVQSVCHQYNVEVMFRQRFKLHSTLVLVKGCDWEAERVKQATLRLILYMCGEAHASQVAVEMSLEISPQHHSVVLGRQSSNLKVIMQQTGTRILFPDAEDPNIPPLKKSNIRITGNIDKVYLARQQLIGSLPLIVMFELQSGVTTEYEDRVSQLMQNLDVNIKMRQKPRQSTLSVLVKGIEKQAGNVYVACHKLLNLEGPIVTADIPPSYHLPSLDQIMFNSDLRDLRSGFRQLSVNTGGGGLMSPLFSPQSPTGFPSPQRSPWIQSQMYWPQQQLASRATQQNMMLPHLTTMPRIIVPQHTYQPMYPSPDSAIHSTSVSSLSSPSLSPRQSTSSSPTHGITNEGAIDLAAMLSGMSDRRAPGCERKTLEKVANSLSPPDYKKMQAYHAMQTKPVSSEIRVPTSKWSGAGLSVSTPDYVLRKLKQSEEQMCEIDGWPSSPMGPDSTSSLSASNYLDSVPQRTLQTLQENGIPVDLTTLLVQHGLERYIDMFAAHEIDLNTFLTLTEVDLQQLGVDKFGPRRRMGTIITDLKDRQQRDSPPSQGSPHYDTRWH